MATPRSNDDHNGHGSLNGREKQVAPAKRERSANELLKPPFPAQHLTDTGSERELEPRPLYAGQAYRAAGKLAGKVAMITGADSGIGRAVAVAYAREGADVAILYYSHDADAEETRRAVEDTGRRALTIRGDVSDETFCRRAAQQVVDE